MSHPPIPTDSTADVRNRLQSMRESLHNVPKPQRSLVQEAFHELMETIEVLSAAEEKLKARNAELVQSRQQIEVEKSRYRDLFEFAPDGYLITDNDGVIREANRAASILLHSSARHLVRRTLTSFVEPNCRQKFREELECLPALGYLAHFETVLRPRDCGPYPAALTANAIRDEKGTVTGLRWLIRDISERKRIESHILELREELYRHDE